MITTTEEDVYNSSTSNNKKNIGSNWDWIEYITASLDWLLMSSIDQNVWNPS